MALWDPPTVSVGVGSAAATCRCQPLAPSAMVLARRHFPSLSQRLMPNLPRKSSQLRLYGVISEEEKPPDKIHPKQKSSSEQVFLNNSRWVPDSHHREESKNSREIFEKVRVNAVFFWYFRFWVGFWASVDIFCRV